MSAPTIDEPPELPVFPARRGEADQPATFFPKLLAYFTWFTLFRAYLVQLIAYLEALGGGSGASGGFIPVDVAETEYTLSAGDVGRHLRFLADDDVTVVVPPDVGFVIGESVRFTQSGAGTITLVEGEGVTVNWLHGLVSEGRYAVFELEYVGTDAWDAFGDLLEANPWDGVDIIFDADFKNGNYTLEHVASSLAAMFESGATSWDTYSLPTVTAGQGIVAEATEAVGGFDGETIYFAPKVSLAGTIGDVFVVAAVVSVPILTSDAGTDDFATGGIDMFASDEPGFVTIGPSSGVFSDSSTVLPPDSYIYAGTSGSSETTTADEISATVQSVGYIDTAHLLGRASVNGSTGTTEDFDPTDAFTFNELRCALGAAASNGHAKAVLHRLVIGHVTDYIDVALLSDAEIPGEEEVSATYDDEQAQDAIGGILVDSSTIDFTYDDATPSITASVKTGSIGATELAATAVTPGSYTNTDLTVDADGRITAASNGSAGSSYTDEMARDAIGTALVGGTGITVTPNDGADTITVATTITQYTDEMARDALGTALVAGSNVTITVNDGADTITIAATGGGGSYTDEEAQDAVGTILTDSSHIDFTYNDGAPSITASIIAGSIGATELASTAVTPGTYGDGTHVAQITVDADGRVTAASNVAVSGGSSGGVIPVVDGSIPPIFIQNPDGSLVYAPI